jgi:hypothetical protein
MKELAAYLLLLGTAYLAALPFHAPSLLLPHPHLATHQAFILLQGQLPASHPSLPLYERVYLLSD